MKKLSIHVVMNDGTEYDTESKTSDYLLYENTARKHKWGGISDNPALWEAFIAWAALKRTGQIDLAWEKFIEASDTVEGTSADVDPTTVAVGDGS
jgi:hypothetical protein